MARLGIGARLTVGAVLTAELAAAASGCTVKSDEHQPIQNRVTHAYTAQWIGAPGFHGYGCLAKTKVDPKPNEFSDYDPATLTVHPEDSTLTVTSALGDVTLRMGYTLTTDPNGKTSISTFPADEDARTYMLAQGCELSE